MIIAQIATQPPRELTLSIAVQSLRPQVDRINIMHDARSDGMKFYGLDLCGPDDIIFVCDDDIEYPPDFVRTMISYLKPGVVVTVMGKILKPRPIQAYYQDELVCYRTFEANNKLSKVEIPGTCGMAFHRSTCPDLDETYFKSINSDVWMGIYCKDRGIPAYVVPHRGDWLKNLMPMLPVDTPSVFETYQYNCQHMTDLINERL